MLSDRFFKLGVFYGLIGITLGLVMGISLDHSQMPTHAHINLLGFVCMMIFGVYYRLHPDAEDSRLAQAHFWLWNIGFVIMAGSLFFLYAGHDEFGPVVGVGAPIVVLAMFLFAWLVFRGARKS